MKPFVVSALFFLAFQGPVQAAITCTTTADCAWGETCVAGDSISSIQACVPATVCGGSSTGNCPSDADSGKLACLWRPYDDCSEGCALMDGKKGIYKCVSLTRCDAYYGDASCSDGCSVNGVRCNGQGSCNMISTNGDGSPTFGCQCENGYTGDKCEAAPGSTVSNSSASSASASDSNGENSFWGALKAADFPMDSSGDISSDEDSSANTSDDSSTDTSDDSSTDTLNDSSTDGSDDSSSDNIEESKASNSNDKSSSNSPPEAAAKSVITASESSIRPGVLILVLVMATFFLVGTTILVAYSRRRKQREEEEYAGALASTHGVGAMGSVDVAGGHTGRTPQHGIATF